MRFLKLTLKHFRGVEAAEVLFRETGVTVVCGPNEVGKSSLAEAIDLLFDYPDSSAAKRVKAVQPVHRDAGSEIELEFTAGAYRATYRKRFNRGSGTELIVHAPRPENLTGREAHERVEGILQESVDIALWRALRMQQGSPLAYPELDARGSLAAALDRASGQSSHAGEAETSIFDSAKLEYERYFTATGQRRTLLREAESTVSEARTRFNEAQAVMEAVERDVAECARLDGEIATARAGLDELGGRSAEAREALAELERHERSFEALAERLLSADSAHREAEIHKNSRQELIDRVEKASRAHERLLGAVAEGEPTLVKLREQEAIARGAVADARTQQQTVSGALHQALSDLEFRRAEVAYGELAERRSRVQDEEKKARAATDVLERSRVDEDLLEDIRAAYLEVERARASAEAGSPRLRVEAMEHLTLGVGGDRTQLEPGERWSVIVKDTTEIVLDELAQVRVEPAADSRSLQDALREAEDRYRELLQRAGVADLTAAIRGERERSEAARVVADRNRIIAENLRELSRAELEAKTEGLDEFINSYLTERSSELPLPADVESAQHEVERLRSAVAEIDRAREAADLALEAIRDQLVAQDREQAAVLATANQQAAQLTVDREALDHARATAPDELLSQAVDRSAEARDRIAEEVHLAREELDARNPEAIRLLADNAAAALEAAKNRIRVAENARIGVRARLDVAGERGLADAVGEAELEVARAAETLAALERLSAAAKRLFETLRTKRDEARRGYVRPLTDRIESLGAHVFGRDFRVELDNSLRITQRTQRGRTVRFDSLSGGAKEQLALLTRLACALTVAEEGGVPLIIDDALGYSDSVRLEALGAVLALAGRSCQVIVLTCAPERYRHVGTAELIPLRTAASM